MNSLSKYGDSAGNRPRPLFASRQAPDPRAADRIVRISCCADIDRRTPLEAPRLELFLCGGWFVGHDGARILHTCPDSKGPPSICMSPRDATSTATTRTMVADPDHSLYQGRFSPAGKWITFNAQSLKNVGTSLLGVVPAAGGKWTALTDASLWVDKPRWGPDGRTIYFISNRQGSFFEVWGLPFDPVSEPAAGEEFRVTHTESPGRTITPAAGSELGISSTWVIVPITESKGSVWLLDGLSSRTS